MKWIISACSTLSGDPAAQIPFLERELKMYLVARDYQLPYHTNHLISEAKIQYDYEITNRHCRIEVKITSTTWTPFVNREYPQVVMLVEDFFKLYSRYWYFLETVTPAESEAIEILGRTLDPLMIKERLDQMDLAILPKIPHIERIGQYNNQQTDIYSGTTTQYKDLTDFWIAYIAWISNGQIQRNDLTPIRNAPFFDRDFYGSCIPVALTEVEGYILEIQSVVKDVTPDLIKECLLMRKDWYDSIYLFDLGSNYIIHNWWTGE